MRREEIRWRSPARSASTSTRIHISQGDGIGADHSVTAVAITTTAGSKKMRPVFTLRAGLRIRRRAMIATTIIGTI